MSYRKFLLLFCFIMIFAISGCGERAEKEKMEKPVTIPQEVPPIEQMAVEEELPSEPKTVGPVEKPQMPMIEPVKEIVLKEGELLVADFEGWPNNLGGEMGVYGSLEPDWDKKQIVPYSWVYETITAGYDPKNVHSGKQSFRLVNGLGTKPEETWGSFAMDLGPTIDLTVVPKKVESLNVSGYKYLAFWAKGERGGEKMELVLRDAHALTYMPQVKRKLPDLTTEWQKITVPLEELAGKVDLTQLDNIGIAFGRDVGNMGGDIAYIDDFLFTK